MALVDRLAAYFEARPHTWLDGCEIANVGGIYGWRSRISELRHPPFNMTIRNRQIRVRLDRRVFIVSEYCFIPSPDRATGCADSETTVSPPAP